MPNKIIDDALVVGLASYDDMLMIGIARDYKGYMAVRTIHEFLYCLLKRIDQISQSIAEYYSRQWTDKECEIMNEIDFRYWECECHYQAPYGFVVMGGCKYHD